MLLADVADEVVGVAAGSSGLIQGDARPLDDEWRVVDADPAAAGWLPLAPALPARLAEPASLPAAELAPDAVAEAADEGPEALLEAPELDDAEDDEARRLAGGGRSLHASASSLGSGWLGEKTRAPP